MSSESSYIGKTYVDDRKDLTDDRANDSAQSDKNSVVRHSELPEGTRVIKPDTMVTMDFNENRLNLEVDEGNVITGTRRG